MDVNTLVKENGRLRYIEPTNIGVSSDFGETINFPYEDYCMSVDLTVKITDRYSCGWAKECGEIKEVTFSSKDGSLSFLGGSKINENEENGYLTTRFTDISMTSPNTNTSECLGIESINIAYGNWMFPTVDIKFIDVRGASVMMPSENNYYNSEERGTSLDIYKALFTFPYPLFELKVKGFYGKGVTYKITPFRVNMDFNNETGNFNITASFIGHMYGVYADLPITYLAIAPYTLEGDKYWKEKIADGTFRFRDTSGNYNRNMITLPELRKSLAEAAKNEYAISAAAEGKAVLDNIDGQITALRGIQDSFPFYESEWKFYDITSTKHKYKGFFYKLVQTKDEVNEINKGVLNFLEIVKNYDKTYGEGNGFYNKFKDLESNIKKEKINLINYVHYKEDRTQEIKTFQIDFSNGTSKDERLLYENFIAYCPSVKEYINTESKARNIYNFYVVFFGLKNTNDDYKSFFESILGNSEGSLIKSLEKRKDYEEFSYKEKESQIIEQILGFRPSIKNIFNLLFAHMETFLHCFFKNTKNIRSEIESSSEKRKKTHYSLNNGDTDTEDSVTSTVNNTSTNPLSKRSTFLPPYFAYYRDKRENGNNKKTFTWPGKLINSKDLQEVKFVKELINGSEMYKIESDKIDEYLQSLSGATKNGFQVLNSTKKTPSSIVSSFIPLTKYDFIFKDDMENPYNKIKRNLVFNNGTNITEDILGTFALRLFYYLTCNNSYYDALMFGIIEAINVYKAIGENYNESFIKFIKDFADNASKNADIEKLIQLVTIENNNIWSFNLSGKTNNSLLKIVGDKLIYNLHKKEKGAFIPLGVSDFNIIHDNFIKDNIENNKNYVKLSPSYSGNQISQTFYVFESSDYIANIYKNIVEEFEISKSSLEETNEGYRKKGSSEWGTIKRETRVLNRYTDDAETELDGKYYDSNTVIKVENGELKKLNKSDVLEILKGDDEIKKNCYIKFPSKVDEKEKESIFEHDLYKQQTTNEAKAYLFLQSLPIRDKWIHSYQGGIAVFNNDGVNLKSRLLREGSYYWWNENVWANKEHYDSNIFKCDGYKIPGEYETFVGDSAKNTYETINPILLNDNGNKTYFSWDEPKNCSESRKKVLKDLFIQWANGTNDILELSFGANEKRLTNVLLYNKNNGLFEDKTKRSLNNGLDIELVISEDHRSDNEEARILQKFLKDLFFSVYTTIDFGNINYNTSAITESTISCCDKDNFERAFKYFMKELNAIYGQTAEEAKNNPVGIEKMRTEQEVNNPFKNDDIYLSTYMTLKSLYDKWLCGPERGASKTWTLNRGVDSDFNNFLYVDTFYNDIGDKLTVNVSKVSSWLSSCLPTSNLNSNEGSMNYNGKSVYDFLTSVAQDCGGMLLALPHKFGGHTSNRMVEMFTPMPLYSNWDDNSSSFVFMYSYKPSEHLGDSEASKYDMNGWSPEGDSFNLTNSDLMGTIFEGNDGYTVPAFGVTYAKQNQSMFKNISLNAENNGTTEAGISATLNIAAKSSESPRETTFYGQDLYRVYSNYSYKCSLETMGNMQITPLMYFQLNNIPLWKGAYMITKVSHSLIAGNISTSFEGVRVNRHAIPLAGGTAIILKDTGNHDSNDNLLGIDNRGNINNDVAVVSENDIVNEIGNSNLILSEESEFNETNVTKLKPIICLTPAHGPKTGKKEEYFWSKKVVDKIKEELSNFTYYDGSPYNIQVCNKNTEKYTSSKGYSMKQTKKIIEKYGSESVVSVVPHWNGGMQNYYLVVLDYKNRIRQDSLKLAECMIGEAKKFKNEEPDSWSKATAGAFNIKSYEDATGRVPNPDKDDGACRLNCACILTENWFHDYIVPDGLNYKKHLQDNDTINRLAKAHANAIKKYIDQLV